MSAPEVQLAKWMAAFVMSTVLSCRNIPKGDWAWDHIVLSCGSVVSLRQPMRDEDSACLANMAKAIQEGLKERVWVVVELVCVGKNAALVIEASAVGADAAVWEEMEDHYLLCLAKASGAIGEFGPIRASTAYVTQEDPCWEGDLVFTTSLFSALPAPELSVLLLANNEGQS